jgi:hypothetical protein
MIVQVEGQFVFNNLTLRLDAARVGQSLAYLPEDRVQHHAALDGSCRCSPNGVSSFQATIVNYSSCRQQTSAFALLLNALRY